MRARGPGVRVAGTMPPPDKPQHKLGLALMLLTAVCFGLNPLFARYAYSGGLTPEVTALYRFGGPALVLLPLCAVGRGQWRLALTALGLGAGMGLGLTAYFKALAVLPVALPALVYFTYPAFTLVLGYLLFGERITARAALACLCVLLACALVLSPDRLTTDQIGALLMCLAAPLAYALLLHGLARWLTPLPVMTRAGLTIAGAALALVVLLLLDAQTVKLAPNDALGWVGIVGLMTVCSLVPQVTAVLAVPMLGAGAAAIASSAELATSLAIGWVVLAEPVTGTALIGVGLILAAQWLGAVGRHTPTA